MKVYKTQCVNCLLSPDSIVSPERRREIIEGCAKEQTYFICHKSTIEEGKTCCKTFYDRLGHISQLIRIAERLNVVDFIDQPDAERLPSHKEMSHK